MLRSAALPLSHVPQSPDAVFVYRNEPCAAAFYDRLACIESSDVKIAATAMS